MALIVMPKRRPSVLPGHFWFAPGHTKILHRRKVTVTTAPDRRTATQASKPRRSSPREEVRTMLNKLYTVLFRKLARREATRFNGQLLDQKRDDTLLAVHRAGLLR
jgi:hypothetical protein